MPRSKRSKVEENKGPQGGTHFSGNVGFTALVSIADKSTARKIRENAQKWKYAWVFSVGDMRNAALKDIRTQWKGTGRMFCARNTVMVKAIGSTPEEEVRPGLHVVTKVSNYAAGLVMYLPTRLQKAGFCSCWKCSYKGGCTPRRCAVQYPHQLTELIVSVILGPVCDQTPSPDPPTPLAHALEPRLRQLGLSTRLVRGVPTISAPHVVCKDGQQLTAEQAALLRLLGIQMTEFRIKCICWWGEEEGLTELEADTQAALGGEDEGESENDDMDSESHLCAPIPRHASFIVRTKSNCTSPTPEKAGIAPRRKVSAGDKPMHEVGRSSKRKTCSEQLNYRLLKNTTLHAIKPLQVIVDACFIYGSRVGQVRPLPEAVWHICRTRRTVLPYTRIPVDGISLISE
ncbi:ribosomal l10 domain-containing protein [Rhizoctonia solani AG-1 IA]|uniref:Ribosomal l10 domain-containing protein n=1 Tax=Thanatephorus cucumeris (strain AG1-IA) TaxID=983506 RepID=L8WPA5_THACA|nr:ribosomal l10 domain-containing protein [Rhizoctonia solani AG-1 IA]